jgi:integrase
VQPKPIADGPWHSLWTSLWNSESDTLALGLGFFGGLRREELTRLRVYHVDLGGRRLVNFVRKGGGEDVLPLGTMLDVFGARMPQLGSERLWPLVQDRARLRDPKDWLLSWSDLGHEQLGPRRDGLEPGQLDPQHLNHWMEKLCVRSEIAHHTPHQLRHSTATNLLRAGVPLAIVSSLLNHANVQTTMRYLKAGGDALSEWLSAGR